MTSTSALRRTVLAAAFACAFVPVFLTAQAPKPIALEDYARFKRIGGAVLSSDGKWLRYTVTPNDGDGTLFVKSLDTCRTRARDPARHGRACSPTARGTLRTSCAPASSRRTRRGRARRRADARHAAGAKRGRCGACAHARSSCSISERHEDRAAVSRELHVSPDGEWVLIRPQAAGTAPAPAAEGGGRGGRGGADAAPAAATGPAGDSAHAPSHHRRAALRRQRRNSSRSTTATSSWRTRCAARGGSATACTR